MPERSVRLLAVVRCGDASLHRSWATGADFDVGVSYFGGDERRAFPEAAFVHRATGGKWDGLAGFFQAFPEALQAYDYFWFPDDDIEANAADIVRMVELGERYRLDLFQPSLDRASFYSHLITLRHPSFVLRRTNFVEIMVPMLSSRLLRRVLPTIATTRSGFGLDFLWPQLARELDPGSGGAGIAILDEVSVRHTRPVGGSLHAFMKRSGGRSSADELADAVGATMQSRSSQINGIATPRIAVISGLLRTGTTLTGSRLAASLLLDLLVRSRNRTHTAFGPVVRHALKAALVHA